NVGIVNRERPLDPVIADAAITFFEAHIEAMREAVNVEPGFVTLTDRVHDERVAFPLADRHAKPGIAKVVEILARWQRTAVDPDFTWNVSPLEELHQPSWGHEPFGWLVIENQPGNSLRIAFHDRVVGKRGNNRSHETWMVAVQSL